MATHQLVWDYPLTNTGTALHPWSRFGGSNADAYIDQARELLVVNGNTTLWRNILGVSHSYIRAYTLKFRVTPTENSSGYLYFSGMYSGGPFEGGNPKELRIYFDAAGIIPRAYELFTGNLVSSGDFNGQVIPRGIFDLEIMVRSALDTVQIAMRIAHTAGVVRSLFEYQTGTTISVPEPIPTVWGSILHFSGLVDFSVGPITGGEELEEGELEEIYDTNPPPLVITPSSSLILPGATGRISHARIVTGYRSQDQARQFHDAMRGA